MKRRSSGGPDVLLSTGQSMDSFLAHRRGSLPVEILATSFSGKHRHHIDSKFSTLSGIEEKNFVILKEQKKKND